MMPNLARAMLLGPLWVLMTIPMGGAMAGGSGCHEIKDQDRRNYCLAVDKRSITYCYRIRGSDQRNLCLAGVKGSSGRCYAVKDADRRRECVAMVR